MAPNSQPPPAKKVRLSLSSTSTPSSQAASTRDTQSILRSQFKVPSAGTVQHEPPVLSGRLNVWVCPRCETLNSTFQCSNDRCEEIRPQFADREEPFLYTPSQDRTIQPVILPVARSAYDPVPASQIKSTPLQELDTNVPLVTPRVSKRQPPSSVISKSTGNKTPVEVSTPVTDLPSSRVTRSSNRKKPISYIYKDPLASEDNDDDDDAVVDVKRRRVKKDPIGSAPTPSFKAKKSTHKPERDSNSDEDEEYAPIPSDSDSDFPEDEDEAHTAAEDALPELDGDDEEWVPGPDDEKVEETAPESTEAHVEKKGKRGKKAKEVSEKPVPELNPDPEIVSKEYLDNTPGAQDLYKVVKTACDWAKANIGTFSEPSPVQRPMTTRCANVLARVDADFLTRLFLMGISKEVLELLSKSEWSREDLTSLPVPAKDDNRQGCYIGVAHGDLKKSNSSGIDVYVGSTKNLWARTHTHTLYIAKYKPETLRKVERSSLHYTQVCRPGVEATYHTLAAFDDRVQDGYICILEGLFMVIFDTCQHHGRDTCFNASSSVDLIKRWRSILGLVETTWPGMNAAWPPRQGYKDNRLTSSSPCMNPACGQLTYGRGQAPPGYTQARHLANKLNPLGGYHCSTCKSFKKCNGRLPNTKECERTRDPEYVATQAKLRLLRKSPTEDGTCTDCKRANSEINEGGEHRKLRNARLFNGQLIISMLKPFRIICRRCHLFEKQGKPMTPQMAENSAIRSELIQARESGCTIRCDNCSRVEPPNEDPALRHQASERAGKIVVLCKACLKHWNKWGKERPPGFETIMSFREIVTEAKKLGRLVQCAFCKTWTQASSTHVTPTTQGLACRNCLGNLDLKAFTLSGLRAAAE